MVIEQGRRLWHITPKEVKHRRNYQWDWSQALDVGAIPAAGLGFANKKQKRDVPDPLAGLRIQLQNLAGQVPAQVAKQKELNATMANQAKIEGQQGINENIRADRGFGNTSLQDRLNAELYDKLFKSQSAADLAAENWGIGQQANILQGTASMYPSETQLPQEPNQWANLLGAGANMAVQNYMNENQWKNMAKYLNPTAGASGGGTIPISDYPSFGNLKSSLYTKFS